VAEKEVVTTEADSRVRAAERGDAHAENAVHPSREGSVTFVTVGKAISRNEVVAQ
jgi:hypothetical protein